MGSFANSLHVKSGDAQRVATTITEFFAAAGWRPTKKTPGQDDPWGGSSDLRALQISAPCGGWVSILDTDLLGAQDLAPALAKTLKTHAIFFFVNDSDSWSYLLADPQGNVSEYDSDEDADDEDEDAEGDLVEAGPAIAQLQALMQDGSILDKMQEIQKRMSANAPPEIREVEARMNSGRPTAADLRQYQAWAIQEGQKYTAELKSMLGGALDPFRVPPKRHLKKKPTRKPTKAERAAQDQRLYPLRPLYAAGVDDDRVLAVLARRAVFAEDVLAEFLPLIGIDSFYSHLSYRYLGQSSTDQLAPHNLRFVHHLRFENP